MIGTEEEVRDWIKADAKSECENGSDRRQFRPNTLSLYPYTKSQLAYVSVSHSAGVSWRSHEYFFRGKVYEETLKA